MGQKKEEGKMVEEIKKLKELQSRKSELVSESAHQIRTSLSALKWIIRMFLDGDLGRPNAEQENLMEKASEDTERAIQTVSELLLINKNEELAEKKYNFQETDLIELIEDSIFDFSGEARAREVEVIFLKPEEKLPKVLADRDKLLVVLQNLLENAIKYSDKHEKVFLALRRGDKVLEVSIKNTGSAIPAENREKIFERYYRGAEAQKREISGSGIGLFTAKKIVEKHRGKIWFESDAQSGTIFFFTLPLAPI